MKKTKKIMSLLVLLLMTLAFTSCSFISRNTGTGFVVNEISMIYPSVTYKIKTKTVIKKAGFLNLNKVVREKITYKYDDDTHYVKRKSGFDVEKYYYDVNSKVIYEKDDFEWEKRKYVSLVGSEFLLTEYFPEGYLVKPSYIRSYFDRKNGKLVARLDSLTDDYIGFNYLYTYNLERIIKEELSEKHKYSVRHFELKKYAVSGIGKNITKVEIELKFKVLDIDNKKEYEAIQYVEIKIRCKKMTFVNIPFYLNSVSEKED